MSKPSNGEGWVDPDEFWRRASGNSLKTARRWLAAVVLAAVGPAAVEPDPESEAAQSQRRKT